REQWLPEIVDPMCAQAVSTTHELEQHGSDARIAILRKCRRACELRVAVPHFEHALDEALPQHRIALFGGPLPRPLTIFVVDAHRRMHAARYARADRVDRRGELRIGDIAPQREQSLEPGTICCDPRKPRHARSIVRHALAMMSQPHWLAHL